MNKTLSDIVDAISLQPAIELTRAWGGRFLYVPKDMHERHPIALCIGLAAAKKLSAAYPAEQLAIPAERNLLLELRNQAICEEYAAGMSISKLSDRFGVSRSMVLKVLDKLSVPRRADVA